MGKKYGHRVFLTVFALLILLTAAAAVYKHYVIRDFETFFRVECDPGRESCFVETFEEEGCEEDPSLCENIFKLVALKQYNLRCEPDGGECIESLCAEKPDACIAIECSPERLAHFGIDGSCSP